MFDVIKNNSFRLLGTTANAKVKDRFANISRIKAYAKINKEVNFPLDFTRYLGHIDRSQESLDAATDELKTKNGLLKNSLSWIYTITPEQIEASEFLIQ
ncbi:MAG: hypothetical protein IJS50_06430, partial [Desulfovibrio sp.]|nr:hypothetical protein [Desulfovibrio sp.]